MLCDQQPLAVAPTDTPRKPPQKLEPRGPAPPQTSLLFREAKSEGLLPASEKAPSGLRLCSHLLPSLSVFRRPLRPAHENLSPPQRPLTLDAALESELRSGYPANVEAPGQALPQRVETVVQVPHPS